MSRRLLVVILLPILGCSPRDRTSPLAGREASRPAVRGKPKIPADISYRITEDVKGFGLAGPAEAKRTVYVLLSRKVPEKLIREISEEIKSSEQPRYGLTYIYFQLPSIIPGGKDRPWAYSMFNHDLKEYPAIQITGMTIEQEAELRKVQLERYGPDARAWLIEMPYSCRVEVLYPTSIGLRLDSLTASGQIGTLDVVELPPGDRGRRFRLVRGGNEFEVDRTGAVRKYQLDGEVLAEGEPLTGNEPSGL